jgi:hypothetical protein
MHCLERLFEPVHEDDLALRVHNVFALRRGERTGARS